jgi:site-specific DNA-methyltransferase (adenine-specific)
MVPVHDSQRRGAPVPRGGADVKPYYADEWVRIYHGDCREVLPSLGTDIAVVSDPPYGMDANTDTRRFSGGKFGSGRRAQGRAARPVHGDKEPFDPAPFVAYPQVLLWGVNHFAARVPIGSWFIWQKKPAERFGTFLSDAEVAWFKGGHGVYMTLLPWEGMCRSEEVQEFYHPTQKPAALMARCITRAAPGSRLIVDPFMGCGPTLVAAKNMGRPAVGIEINEQYCETAAERCRQEVLALGGAA